MNFYRCFIPHATGILLLLTAALKGGLKGCHKLEWSTAMVGAFEVAKTQLG